MILPGMIFPGVICVAKAVGADYPTLLQEDKGNGSHFEALYITHCFICSENALSLSSTLPPTRVSTSLGFHVPKFVP